MPTYDNASTLKLKAQWEQITREIDREKDPAKVAILAHKLNEAMLADQRAKARLRVMRIPDST